jgi:hypothetical protein
MTTYEETGQYKIEVFPEKNHWNLFFTGTAKKPADIPHYLEHVKKALAELKPNLTLYVELTTHVSPGFSITALFRESQKLTVEIGIRKAAIYLPPSFIVESMILKVTRKLSQMPINIFNKKDEALKWLEEQ